MPTSTIPQVICASDIMTTELVTLKPEMDVFHGINELVRNRISGAPVVNEEGDLLGVFSEKSCMQVLIGAAYEGLPTNQIQAFMNKSPKTICETTQLMSIAQVFLTTPLRRLPVMRGSQLVGLVSRRDVIAAAAKVERVSRDRESTLLYLSALRESQDPPPSKLK